jgi:hypothetical protein
MTITLKECLTQPKEKIRQILQCFFIRLSAIEYKKRNHLKVPFLRPDPNYDHYLAQGYTIASGVAESACGHVVKDRTKISGARWCINGAESILKLRSVEKSNDWDDY